MTANVKAKLVACDLDGTLADTRCDLTDAVNDLRAEYGLSELDMATVISYVGNGVGKLVERSLADVPELIIEDALARMKKHYDFHLLGKAELYPSVLHGLRSLRDGGWLLAVVTNKNGDASRKLLAHLGIADLFSLVLGAGDAPLKPDPAVLLRAMREMGAEPEHSWMIGDNYTDLAVGRNAGTKRCFARYGFGDQAGEKYDLAVDLFAEFATYLLEKE